MSENRLMLTNRIWNESIAPLLSLRVARFKIEFLADKRWRIYGQEAALRGRLGFNLKRVCCPYPNFRQRACDDCVLCGSCLYLTLFAPVPKPPEVTADGRLKTGPASVRPFVIASDGADGRSELAPGETGNAYFTLFGPGIQYASLFLEAAAAALSSFPLTVTDLNPMRPLGTEAETADNQIAWLLHDWVRSDVAPDTTVAGAADDFGKDLLQLEFATPVRLFSNNRQTRHSVSLALIVKVLIRRLRDLKRRYDDNCKMGRTGKHFYHTAESVRVADDNLWYSRRKRYSHRQHQEVYLNGLKGEIRFQGPFHPFLPLLRAGEIVHIGKGISCGNGKMRVQNREGLSYFSVSSALPQI